MTQKMQHYAEKKNEAKSPEYISKLISPVREASCCILQTPFLHSAKRRKHGLSVWETRMEKKCSIFSIPWKTGILSVMVPWWVLSMCLCGVCSQWPLTGSWEVGIACRLMHRMAWDCFLTIPEFLSVESKKDSQTSSPLSIQCPHVQRAFLSANLCS